MKIIHFSDTHLGFSDYTKIEPETGLNLLGREFDDKREQGELWIIWKDSFHYNHIICIIYVLVEHI